MTDSLMDATPILIYIGLVILLADMLQRRYDMGQSEEELVNDISLIERSVCDCDRCKCGCKAQPGFLAPGDLEAIANHLGHDRWDDDFLKESFVASEGSTVIDKGELKQIATITPRQLDSGRCVFLNGNDECTIHPVSPFGCRNFKICDDTESPAESGNKIGLALRAIEASVDYKFSWGELAVGGCFARPIVQRKKELLDKLSEVYRSEMDSPD